MLLEHGANVNLKDKKDKSALRYASCKGFTTTVKLLLNHKANVRGSDGLSDAYWNGHIEVAALLIKYGANLDCHCSTNDQTSLMIAIQRKDVKIIEQLLELGANVNIQDKRGQTALIIACKNEPEVEPLNELEKLIRELETRIVLLGKDIIEMLLSHGAHTNLKDCSGLTALFYAYKNGYDEVATMLIKHGANLDYQSKYSRRTSLMFAIQKQNTKVAKQLLEFGASVDTQNKDGQTALIIGCSNRDAEGIELLLKFGANMNIQDDSGQTALNVATLYKNIEAIQLLIKYDADMNVQNRQGHTALMIACEKGYEDIVTLLLTKEGNVNMQNKDGWTALMLACQHGHIKTIKYLIEYGADVNLVKNDGWTALTLAEMNHHTKTVDLLVEYGAMGAISPKQHFRHSTYTEEDSGYSSAEKALNVNTTVISVRNGNDHEQECFSWEGYGLHLYISKGALPSEIRNCTVSVEVSVEGNYIFPDNSHPVSAVYWFHCDPKCKFSKPITLEIQHCAEEQNLNALSFVKATSIKDQSEAKFHRALGCCGTNHGVFPNHSSYGFIQLDQFCGYGVVQEGSEDREYRANLYYLPQGINQFKIDFTVLWNTDAHHSVIETHYRQKKAEIGPDKPVEFDSESIHLDIPKEGIATEDKMWKIIPLVFPPQVTKAEVDKFEEGKRIPACQLLAISQKSQHHELTNLIHPLKLLGTKTLHDYITLFRSPSVNIAGTSTLQEHHYTSLLPTADAENSLYEGDFARLHMQPKSCDPPPNQEIITSSQYCHAAALLPSALSEAPQSHKDLQPDCLQESITATFHHSLSTPQPRAHPEPPRLTILLNELTNRVAAKWEAIGISLQLESGLLEIIKEDNPNDCRARLREMLKEWMKQVNPPPSWSAIIKAVKDAGYSRLARILREKYLPNTCNVTLS